ncbi:DUF4328 domain-containing protein [Kitasatospora sp. NPDC092948]|uniref:DUF4328 domain-containing protein n=1 Tax=Kitasatospora sp. NPDC092948 TaxID=3364088 RepID=UPI00382426BF
MDRPTAPANPKEPALGFQWAMALVVLCTLGLVVAVQRGGASPEVRSLLRFAGGLFTVVASVVGAVWARRCWHNAEVLAPGSQPFRLGWTTAGWLIPVLNVWMRRRILLGLWRTSGVTGAPLPVHLVAAVDALSIATNLLPTGWATGATRWAVLAVALAWAVLFVVTIRRITARQSAVLDVPQTDSWEAAVEADRARQAAT